MTWTLNVVVLEGQADIKTGQSYLKWGGSEKAPGRYDVEKGTEIEYKCVVENVGNTRDQIRIELVDKNTGKVINGGQGYADPGTTLPLGPLTFTLQQDRALEFRAGHEKPDGSFTTDDTYGS